MKSEIRFAVALAAIAALAACDGGRTSAYPRDWPSPVIGAPGGATCADLNGRYAIGEGGLAHMFPRPAGANDHGIHWHTLQIGELGPQAHALTFSGNAIDDEAGDPPQTRTATLRWNRCQEGWVRHALGRDQGTPFDRAEGDTRSVERYLLVARDGGGNLVAQEVIERYETISLWAPGGADVRVPFTGSTDRRWSRWLAAGDDPQRPRLNTLARDESPLLRKLGRRLPAEVEVLSRRPEGDGHLIELKLADASQLVLLEERLLSSVDFGEARVVDSQRSAGGGIVATVIVGPPRPAGPDPALLAAARAERERTDDVFKRALTLLRPCSSLSGARPLDDGYLLEVNCPDADALSAFVGNLRDSPAFGIPEVRDTRPYIRQQVSASVWVRVR